METISIEEVKGNKNGIIEAGETLKFSVEVTNPTKVLLREVEGVVKVKFGMEFVTIEDPSLDWADLDPQTTSPIIEEFTLKVKDDAPVGSKFKLLFALESTHAEFEVVEKYYIGK